MGQTDDRPLDNRGGSVDIEALGSKERIRKNCKIVYEEVKVDYLGNVLLCSNDYYREHNFGNLKEKKFMDIWKDAKSRNNIIKSIRNIPNVKITDVNHFSAYDLAKFKKIIFTETSIKELEKRY